MSRIGKTPVAIPEKVQVTLAGQKITVKGPKGTLENTFPNRVSVKIDKENNCIVVDRASDTKSDRAFHGLWRALINNMVVGVSVGFSKTLKIIGTGYRAQCKGNKLTLTIGFSHLVHFDMPEGLTCTTPGPQEIIISGCDKHMVGQVAANIRKVRPPEPYKGKGIRYKDEYVRHLVGKTFGSK